MHWMVAHVYVVLLGLLAFIVIAGGLVITDDSANSPGTVNTWNRAGGFTFLKNEMAEPRTTSQRHTVPDIIGTAGEYTPIHIPKSQDVGSGASTLPDEWQSLLTQLTQPSAGAVQSEEAETTGAYSFIPQGMVRIANPTLERTPTQEALYVYGNQVGVLIRSFDESHTDMITVLKDAYADRSNASKREAAERIGVDYEALGKELAALADVPPSIKSMHTAIAQSYQEAGKKMVEKLRTQSDEEFLAAMHAYNAAAQKFTQNFVALATYLSASGVKFSSSEPGSVFTFTSF